MLIFDTNLWVSYSLMPTSRLARTVDAALDLDVYAFSDKSFTELSDVLMRAKFDRYLSHKERRRTLKKIALVAKWYTPTETIRDCSDPKDNMFLELAVASQADYLITGDDDLLILDPFRKTRILTLSEFAEHHFPNV